MLPDIFKRNFQTHEDTDDLIKSNVYLFEKHHDDIHQDSQLACSLFEEKSINTYIVITF